MFNVGDQIGHVHFPKIKGVIKEIDNEFAVAIWTTVDNYTYAVKEDMSHYRPLIFTYDPTQAGDTDEDI